MAVYKVHFKGRTAKGKSYKSWYPLEAPDLETAHALAVEAKEPDEVITSVKYWKES